MTQRKLRKSNGLSGTLLLPGDKSIAHRAAILAAISFGDSVLANYPTSADPQSTLSVLRQLGIQFEEKDDGIHVFGSGVRGLKAPTDALDCGNSGTTMRLMAGVLAGCDFESTLVGDESLSARPMERIAGPLREMGASINLHNGKPPIVVRGGDLKPIDFTLPVASAQVKSSVLLAGLSLPDQTVVREPVRTRDHTERMLALDSIELGNEKVITVSSSDVPAGRTWVVPKDFSAAAFFLVAASIIPNSKIVLEGVGINPSRTGLITVLRAMGAEITVVSERSFAGETIADIGVESADLQAVSIPADIIPNMIDEIPILAVAATQASGTTVVRNASELRVKESDRIDAMVTNLRLLGADVKEYPDGFEISGPCSLQGATVDSRGDHRIAMAMAIAGLVADGETTIGGSDCVDVSFPGFFDQIERISLLQGI